MRIERLVLGDLGTNCWVVSDDAGGPAVVIDPAGDAADAPRIVAAAGGRPIRLVVLTHAHFDHLGAAAALVQATGAPLAVHEIDAPRITHAAPHGTGGALFGYSDIAPPADRLLSEGERIEAGDVTLEVWLTPGHTAGSICLLASEVRGMGTTADASVDASAHAPAHAPAAASAHAPAHLFSGDTLFAGSVGRTDFPAGDGRDMQRSIARIATLADDTVVHPGHGPGTTVGRERRVNPFFPRV